MYLYNFLAKLNLNTFYEILRKICKVYFVNKFVSIKFYIDKGL